MGSTADIDILMFGQKMNFIFGVYTQHDEVEPNLKKILHTNGIWGLEANSMEFHQPI